MKQVILLHNPSAGDEDHLKDDLVNSIEKQGFGCTYFSIKKDNWKDQLDNADFAVVGGGDGTVRRVVKELVNRSVLDKRLPIAVLPMGTANNLSKTLGIDTEASHKKQIKSWKKPKLQKFDVGVIKNIDTTDFFIESVGFGVFPRLMKEMDSVDKSDVKTTKDELKLALKVFYKIVKSAKAEKCSLIADGITYEGNYLLVEVMNSLSIGPNLVLAPKVKLDDAVFDVVLLEEHQREEFLEYINNLIEDKEATFNSNAFTAKKLTVTSGSKWMHIDDELIIPMKNPISIEVRESILEFIV